MPTAPTPLPTLPAAPAAARPTGAPAATTTSPWPAAPRRHIRPRTPFDGDGEQVEFTAACPRCHEDARWTETRADTRTSIAIDCVCRP